MIETFSWNLLLQGWGNLLVFAAFLLSIVLVLLCTGLFFDGISKIRNSWIRRLLFSIGIALPIGSLILSGYAVGFYRHGELDGVIVSKKNEQHIFYARFSGYGKSGKVESFFVFNQNGKILAREGGSRKTISVYNQVELLKDRSLWTLLTTGEAFKWVHRDTREDLVDVTSIFNRRYGAEAYQVKDISEGKFLLEFLDGRTEWIDSKTLLPQAFPNNKGEEINLLSAEHCRVAVSSDTGKHELGFLRAQVFQVRTQTPCSYALSEEASLFLHRSTAFGEGKYLLSAVSVKNPDTVLFSTDMTIVLNGVENFRLIRPHADEKKICMWLIRERYSLSRLCLDKKTGNILSTKIIF